MTYLCLIIILAVTYLGYFNFKKSVLINFYDIFFFYYLVTYPAAYVNIVFFSNILPNNTIRVEGIYFYKTIIEDSIFFLLIFLSKFFIKDYYVNSINKIALNNYLKNLNLNIYFFASLCFLLFLSSTYIDNLHLLRIFEYAEISCLFILIASIYLKTKRKLLQYLMIFITMLIYALIALKMPSGKGYIKDFVIILLIFNFLSNNNYFLFLKNNFFKFIFSLVFLQFLIAILEIVVKKTDYSYCYSTCLFGYDLNEFLTPIGASEIINTVRIISYQISNINYPVILSIIENTIPNNLYSGFNLETPTLMFEKLFNLTTTHPFDSENYEYYSGLGLGLSNYFRLFFIDITDSFSVFILFLFFLVFINYFGSKYFISLITFYPIYLITIHRLIRTDPVHFINSIIFLALGCLLVIVLYLIYSRYIINKLN